jgi:hypothetical protein
MGNGGHVRVEERMLVGFLDLCERSSLSGNARGCLTLTCQVLVLSDKQRMNIYYSPYNHLPVNSQHSLGFLLYSLGAHVATHGVLFWIQCD